MNELTELANSVANITIPKCVISVDIDGPYLFDRKEVHVDREALLDAIDMEHIERIRKPEYDRLETTINGVTFFCIERRAEA